MIPKPIEAINSSDLHELVAQEVRERRDLEFKRDLPGGKDSDVREFLADVTAMANAQGGDIIYGVEDADGVASSLPGLTVLDPETEFSRIDSRLQSGTDPRLTGVRMRWIEIGEGRGCILLRVPASLAVPHAGRHAGIRRFHTRGSSGKYKMDTHELRHAFISSEQVPQRLRSLHEQAVSDTAGENLPFQIDTLPVVILSVIPLGFFRDVRDLPITPENAIAPHRVDGAIESALTLEGVLLSTRLNRDTVSERNAVRSYALTHRSGRVDAAWTLADATDALGKPRPLVDPRYFEAGVLDIGVATTSRLQEFGLRGPWGLLATIQGIRDYPLIINNRQLSKPAFRSGATLPEAIVDRVDDQSLLPSFEAFWRLFGVARPAGRQSN